MLYMMLNLSHITLSIYSRMLTRPRPSGLNQRATMTQATLSLCTILLLTWPDPSLQQQAATDTSTMRSTNSVDIQVCAGGVLANYRDAFEAALLQSLQTKLRSLAVYLDTGYSDTDGDMCLLYVLQAPNPTAAAQAFQYLNPQGSGSVTFLQPFQQAGVTAQANCTLTAAQWSGFSLSYLGAPLPSMWTVNDLLLWGSCGVGVLALVLAAGCCYALRVTTAHTFEEEFERLWQEEKKLEKDLNRSRASSVSGGGGSGVK